MLDKSKIINKYGLKIPEWTKSLFYALKNQKMNPENIKIAVIGQGYVGLPLAIEFGKKYSTLGFDINNDRIKELKRIDHTNEASAEQLKITNLLSFTANNNDEDYNIYIVTVQPQ